MKVYIVTVRYSTHTETNKAFINESDAHRYTERMNKGTGYWYYEKCDLFEHDLLKPITIEELAEMGYKLEEK